MDVKAASQNDPTADVEQRGQEGKQPAGVEQGREHRRHVALGQAPADDGVDAVPEDLPVGDHGPFGPSRRARGVEDAVGGVVVGSRPAGSAVGAAASRSS